MRSIHPSSPLRSARRGGKAGRLQPAPCDSRAEARPPLRGRGWGGGGRAVGPGGWGPRGLPAGFDHILGSHGSGPRAEGARVHGGLFGNMGALQPARAQGGGRGRSRAVGGRERALAAWWMGFRGAARGSLGRSGLGHGRVWSSAAHGERGGLFWTGRGWGGLAPARVSENGLGWMGAGGAPPKRRPERGKPAKEGRRALSGLEGGRVWEGGGRWGGRRKCGYA